MSANAWSPGCSSIAKPLLRSDRTRFKPEVTLDGVGLLGGQTFSFRVDANPASISGPAPGPNDAGSVSGYEHTGASVTAQFADGTSRIAEVYGDGTAGGGRATLAPLLLPEVALGITAADGSPLASTLVNGIVQAVLPDLGTIAGAPGDDVVVNVTGTAGQPVRLTVAEIGGLGMDIPLGSHDGNTVLQNPIYLDAMIGADGTVSAPVALPAITAVQNLEPGSVSGRFVIVAALVDPATGDATSRVAQKIVVTDEPPPPNSLSFAAETRGVTANLATAAWSHAPKVMPLGDSNTQGTAPPGQDENGYRGFLWFNLIEDGQLVDLVGPNNNGNIPDPDHAGYPGESANDLLAFTPTLLATHAPDAILLMAGTNDVLQETNAENTVGPEIQGILDLVAQQSPATHTYVSTILPLAADTIGEVDAVNAAIRAVVINAAANGQNVSQVEMPGLTTADLFDGVHPTEEGYRKMADNWTSSVTATPLPALPATPIDAAVTELTGSAHNDLLIGDSRANTLAGGDGNDILIGGAGNDTLITGAGSDRLHFITPDSGDDVAPDFAPGLDKLVFDIAATGVDAFSDLLVTLLGGQVNVAWGPTTAPGVVGLGSVTLSNLTDPQLITAADVQFIA